MKYTEAGKVRVWAGLEKYTSIAVTERIHFDDLGPIVRRNLRAALKRGCLGSTGGDTAWLYRLVTKHFCLPSILASQRTSHSTRIVVNGDWSDDVIGSMRATYKLLGGTHASARPVYNSVLYLWGTVIPMRTIENIITDDYQTHAEKISEAVHLLDTGGYIETVVQDGDHAHG